MREYYSRPRHVVTALGVTSEELTGFAMVSPDMARMIATVNCMRERDFDVLVRLVPQ